MRVVQLKNGFGFEHLHVSRRDPPEPEPSQLRLKMGAIALNYRDVLVVEGSYYPRQPLPLIVASDGVGYIDKLGDAVRGFQLGQRVCPIFAQAWLEGQPDRAKLKSTLGGPLDGTACEYMVVDQAAVVQVPSYLTDLQAATLPCAAVTAYSALMEHAKITENDWILVLGTGGVALFCLGIAKAVGARTIVISKSDDKLVRARALGADHCINYLKTPDWGRAARKLTGSEGVDHVVEVGGPATLAQSLLAIRPGGTISLIGILGGRSATVDLTPVLMQQIRMQGVFVGSKATFEGLNRFLSANELAPVIDRTFRLEETPAALRYLKTAAHFGKICIRLGDGH